MAADDESDEERKKRLARLRAAAIRADSEPRLVEAARWLRSRLPGDTQFGDPLSTAGRTPVELLGRGVSALQAGRPSLAHELGMGALQAWQGVAEASGRGRGEREVTVLFNDLVGFSSWALDAGDEAAIELLRGVGAVTEVAMATGGGRIVKRLGDGVMAVFDDADAAVGAALETNERVAEVKVAGHTPRLRCGAHRGRPRRLGGDYLGVDVNVAARIVAAADGGEVLVSQATTEALDRERFTVGKAKRLKAPGAPKELRVCRVERA